jgi:hypothetical protein
VSGLSNNKPNYNRNLRRVGWLVVIAFGLIEAWANRHYMNPDGVSYLDVAAKYLQGDWNSAVNAYWSPMYSWVIAVIFFLVRPSSYWEYPLVHLINFLIYIVAFVAFEFLLSQVIRLQQNHASSDSQPGLPVWAWQTIGYVLFLWSALVLITVELVTPDMLVAAIIFLLGGLLIRMRLEPFRWLLYALLGLTLGIGYLTKAVIFPLSFVVLIVCLFSTGNKRRALPRVALSLLLFVLVGAPFILALHRATGRWTFSDTGRLAHAWLVDGTQPYVHWQGLPPGTGNPVHPTRKIFDKPPVYEFGQPINATYPPWYDASYWNEGLESRFNPRGQVKVLAEGVLNYYAMLINNPIGMAILISFLVLVVFFGRPFGGWISQFRLWVVLLPAGAALVLYLLIHVEPRYVGAFLVLFWLAMFSVVRLTEGETATKLIFAVMVTLAICSLTVLVAKSITPALSGLNSLRNVASGSDAKYWQVAQALSQQGINSGDPVGYIGVGFGSGSYWAHLAGVRIVSEITSGSDRAPTQDVESFWLSDSSIKRGVIEAFRKTGAKVIVADRIPPGASQDGWRELGSTGHYVYVLK